MSSLKSMPVAAAEAARVMASSSRELPWRAASEAVARDALDPGPGDSDSGGCACAAVNGDGRSDADYGEVGCLVSHLGVGRAGAGRLSGNHDLGQDFVGLEGGGEQVDEEVVG